MKSQLKLTVNGFRLPAAFEENYFGNLNNENVQEPQHIIVNIKWTRLDLKLYIY